MDITVISRETIKPSSPTPHHLSQLKLSLLDQYSPPTLYTRILVLYSAQGDVSRFQNTNMSHLLKKSLSVVLTDFYPLAGTANNNQWIDCDDNGLEYIEARVKAPLTVDRLVSSPNVEEYERLVPHDKTGFKGLSAVQVSVFEECGGMAVGISLSHILTDASSLGMFLDSWARIARGGDKRVPRFTFASLFPPRDIPMPAAPEMSGQDSMTTTTGGEKIITKRFVFPQSKIDTLKARFEYERPTRVEVTTALISKCWMKVSKSRSPRPAYLGTAMNLRSRMSPPLPMDYFGNMIFPLLMPQATAEMSVNEVGVQLRGMIRGVDEDFVKRLQAENGLLLTEIIDQNITNIDARVLAVTSWCRFPFYEADLGWGAPALVVPMQTKYPDCTVLVDAKDGDGIEAWVTLEVEDMAQFDSDNELLEFI